MPLNEPMTLRDIRNDSPRAENQGRAIELIATIHNIVESIENKTSMIRYSRTEKSTEETIDVNNWIEQELIGLRNRLSELNISL